MYFLLQIYGLYPYVVLVGIQLQHVTSLFFFSSHIFIESCGWLICVEKSPFVTAPPGLTSAVTVRTGAPSEFWPQVWNLKLDDIHLFSSVFIFQSCHTKYTLSSYYTPVRHNNIKKMGFILFCEPMKTV